MVGPIQHESDGQRRQWELADSLEFAAQVARDPVMARRVEEARARIVAGDVDEANLLSYEGLVGRIDELRRR
jgi:hypothetical protein